MRLPPSVPFLLALLALPVAPAGESQRTKPLLDYAGLTDGAIADDLGESWQGWPVRQGNRMRAVLSCAPRRPAPGKSLHLHYRFVDPRPAQMGYRAHLAQIDASEFDHLSFWVRGDETIGFAPRFRLELQRPDPEIDGAFERGSVVVDGITGDWQQISVPLNQMTGLRERKPLTALVFTFQSRRSPVREGAYCVDEVMLVKTGQPGPSVHERLEPVRKKAWEEAAGGKQAARALLQKRLIDWPQKLLVDPASLPAEDRAFLLRVARDTWRGLDSLRDRENGLPLDTIRFGDSSTALEASRIGDYTNVTNIGLYLMAVAAARDLGFIDSEAATARIRQLLDTLERLDTYRGFFYNYYDTTSLEHSSHFISFVDSAWLTAGLIVTRQAFSALAERITRLIEREDYGFFYDPVEQLMSHGFYVHLPGYAEYHYGLLFTEARLGSVIAIGKGDVPEEHWYRMVRSFPPSYGWQTQRPQGKVLHKVAGHEVVGGLYRYGNERYIPSWGGSMFEALMPALVLDERRHAPHSLGRNGEIHARVQRDFARDELGYPVWGLSPSATPAGDDYSEFGVKALGAKGYKPGAVTPHAAALAIASLPEEATRNLRELARRYPIYGEYGFYDAVDPRSGQVAYKYLALDQAMLFLALANHLAQRSVQRYFESDPIIQRALPMLAREDFWKDG